MKKSLTTLLLTLIIIFSLCACGKNDNEFLCRIDEIDENIMTVTPDIVSKEGRKYGTIKVMVNDNTVYYDANDKELDSLDFEPESEVFVTYDGVVHEDESPYVIAQTIKSSTEIYVGSDESSTEEISYSANGATTTVVASKLSLKDFELVTPQEGWLISRPESSVVGPMTIYPKDNKDEQIRLTEYVMSDLETEEARVEKTLGSVSWNKVSNDEFDEVETTSVGDCQYTLYVKNSNVLLVEMVCSEESDNYGEFVAILESVSCK